MVTICVTMKKQIVSFTDRSITDPRVS